jgi:hypothetical protein
MSYDPNTPPSGLGPDSNPPSADLGCLAISGHLMLEKMQMIGVLMAAEHSYDIPVVQTDKNYISPGGVHIWRDSSQLAEAQVDTYRITGLDVTDSYYDYVKIVRQSRSLGGQQGEPYALDASSWKAFLLTRNSQTTDAQLNYNPDGQGVELALRPEERQVIGPFVKMTGNDYGDSEEFWSGLARVTHSLTLAGQAAVRLVAAT